MTFAKTIAVLTFSLVLIHCASGEEDAIQAAFQNNRSLLFDGVDDAGSAGDITDTLDRTLETFAISIWFKAAGVPAVDSMMLHMNPEFEDGMTSMQVRLYWETTTTVAFHITPNFLADPGAMLFAEVTDPQAWNHLMLTFNTLADSAHAKIYLNGLEVDSGDQPTPLTAVGNIQFGKEFLDNNYYNGYLDEVAFWNETLTDEEIVSVYNFGEPGDVRSNYDDYRSADVLTSFWRMGDENAADEPNVSDLISENHFTILGGGVFQTDTP